MLPLGYPDLELIQKDSSLILSGKTADVKAAKVKIQEMIVLHDKVYVEQVGSTCHIVLFFLSSQVYIFLSLFRKPTSSLL